MSLLARHFERIVVINLASRRDRYAEMGEQLRRAGLSWASPQVRHFAAARPSDMGGFESIGAHGCFRSHLGAIEQAVADKVDSVLILEDDCSFSADFDARMPKVNAALAASDWSLFYGGWHLYGRSPPLPWTSTPTLPRLRSPFSVLRRAISVQSGATTRPWCAT